MRHEDSIVNDHQESNRTSMRNHVLSYPCLFPCFPRPFCFHEIPDLPSAYRPLGTPFVVPFRTGHIMAELTSF